MLALALRSRTYLGERCTCGVLTRCGMGYQAPQVVCNRWQQPPLSGALSGVLVGYAAREASCGVTPHAEEPL